MSGVLLTQWFTPLPSFSPINTTVTLYLAYLSLDTHTQQFPKLTLLPNMIVWKFKISFASIFRDQSIRHWRPTVKFLCLSIIWNYSSLHELDRLKGFYVICNDRLHLIVYVSCIHKIWLCFQSQTYETPLINSSIVYLYLFLIIPAFTSRFIREISPQRVIEILFTAA